MGNKQIFQLQRFDDTALHEQLETHRAQCRTCRRPDVTRIQAACQRAQQIHEQTVRGAHANLALRHNEWWQKIELGDLPNEKTAVEFLEAAKQEQSSFRRLIGWLTRHTPMPSKASTLEGIDVSLWQGPFPWGEAVGQGVQLGIAKASEGNGYTDPQWGWNVGQLLAQGPIVGGSYHFARPDLGNGAAAEAQWYLGRHPAACFSPTLPWAFSLDAESAGGDASWCYAFLSTVGAQTGYTCWFYSYQSWISSRAVAAYGNPLWIAWPNAGSPPNMGWPAITMQQYGTRGFSVGQVDADLFLGDLRTLYVLGGVGGGGPSPTPAPVPGPAPVNTGGFLMSLTDQQQAELYAFVKDVHDGVGALVSPDGPAIAVNTRDQVAQLNDFLLKETYGSVDPANQPIPPTWTIAYTWSAVKKLDAKVDTLGQRVDFLVTQLSADTATINTLSATVVNVQGSASKLQDAVNGLAAALAAGNQADTLAAVQKLQTEVAALGKHLGEGNP